MKKKSILLMFALSLLALTSCSGQGIVGTKVTNDEWMQAFDIENFTNYTVNSSVVSGSYSFTLLGETQTVNGGVSSTQKIVGDEADIITNLDGVEEKIYYRNDGDGTYSMITLMMGEQIVLDMGTTNVVDLTNKELAMYGSLYENYTFENGAYVVQLKDDAMFDVIEELMPGISNIIDYSSLKVEQKIYISSDYQLIGYESVLDGDMVIEMYGIEVSTTYDNYISRSTLTYNNAILDEISY